MSKHLLTSASIAASQEIESRHQFNDAAVRQTRPLSPQCGMAKIGVHLVRLVPGAHSTEHHYHDNDEEFLYVVSGRGVAHIGDEQFEVGPGDFMGFPAPSPAHSLHNPYDEDLVYLMGGERNTNDVVHYPRLQRSMMKSDGKRTWANWSDLNELPPKDG